MAGRALVGLVLCLGSGAAAMATSVGPTVHTAAGELQGAVTQGVAAFRGVQYAQAPVGQLRWRDPRPVGNWSGVRPALADGPGCPQVCKLPTIACPPAYDEACLYLNVFAPAVAVGNSTAGKAVMFWIHGGNFYQGFGGGPLYDGTSYARNHDVVVVSISYRLGALGFLYSGADDSKHFTGNFGLKDQQLAMQWVQTNIAAFGGDPAQVTLFGQSAGAASIGAHLNMPSSAGLFARAILESDPLGLPFREAKRSPAFSKVVATDAGCKKLEYEPCMRALSWKAVLASANKAETDMLAELGHFLSLFQPFSPTVGTPLLPVQPLTGFLAGSAHDVPIVMGSVRQEGLLFVYDAFSSPLPSAEEDALLAAVYGVDNTVKILKQYPRAVDTDKDERNHTTIFATDSLFQCPIRHAQMQLAFLEGNGTRKNPLYAYHFDHVVSFGATFWLPNTPICVDSVCHSEELPFVWNPDLSLLNVTFTPAEVALSRSMQQYWSNFAKTGNPGSGSERESVETALSWPAFKVSDEKVLLFSTEPGNRVVAGFEDKCEFWDRLGYPWVLGH